GADVGGADGQLAVRSVDEDRELHGLRPAEIDDGVERRADRPSREEHVVDEDDGLALDGERNLRAAHHGDPAHAEVVAVERDVERADGERRAVDAGDGGGKPLGEGDAASAQPHEGQVLGAAVALQDLVGDTGEGSVEGGFVENLRLVSKATSVGHRLSLRASRGSLKGRRGSLRSLYMWAPARVNRREGSAADRSSRAW